ncbi:MAG TPA: hypothetical protein VK148_07545 [Xanthobacteraceae bacterium]|jgi:hypothetical protein|nr:hypothetical protein [Xanthobacteraceae bacterium]
MLNRRSKFVLAAGLTLAVAALTAGSASAMGGHASARSAGTHQTMGQPTMVKGIKIPGKVTGITGLKIPGKVTGLSIPPGKVTGLYIPPGKVKGVIVTGIIKPPKITGVIIPPVTGVIVTPPSIAVLPPEEVTYTKRRYSWYTGNTEVAARPAVSTAEAPCNCLTKEYLQDGSVLFKDLCTKEAAVLTVEEMKAKQQGAQNQ